MLLVIYSAFGFIFNDFFFCSHRCSTHTFQIVVDWMRHSCLNEYRENINCSRRRRHTGYCQMAEKLNECEEGKRIWRRLAFATASVSFWFESMYLCLNVRRRIGFNLFIFQSVRQVDIENSRVLNWLFTNLMLRFCLIWNFVYKRNRINTTSCSKVSSMGIKLETNQVTTKRK